MERWFYAMVSLVARVGLFYYLWRLGLQAHFWQWFLVLVIVSSDCSANSLYAEWKAKQGR